MEQLNTIQKETETSNLLFANHFRQVRYNPKIIMKLIHGNKQTNNNEKIIIIALQQRL